MYKILLLYVSWRIKTVIREVTKQLKDPFISSISLATVIIITLASNSLLLWILALIIFLLSKQKILLVLITLISISFFNTWQTHYEQIVNMTQNDESTNYQFSIIKDSIKKKFYNESIGYSQSHPFKFLVQTPSNVLLQRGDLIQANCEILQPINFEDNNFDYVNFLKSQNIYFICKVKEHALVGKSLEELPAKLSREIKGIIEKNFVEPYASIMLGIFLGDKTELSSELKNVFIKTGTLHITAVSGLHFNIFFGLVFGCMFFLNVYKRLTVALIVSFLYLSVIGFDNISANRSFFMLVFVSIGIMYGRIISPSKALLIATSLSIITYPPIINNVSFLLSYGATFSILVFYRRIDYLLKLNFSFLSHKIITFISVFLSVSIAIIPMSVMFFGGYSILSLIGNLLLATAICFILLASVLGILLSYFYPLGEMLFLILEKLLEVLIKTLEWLASQNISYTEDIKLILFLAIIFYAPIIILDLRYFYNKYLR